MSRNFLALECFALFSLLGSIATAAQPPVTAIAFAPDGHSVVIGSQAGVVVCSWPELVQRRQIQTKLVSVHDLAFSPSGQALAIAGGSPAESGIVEIVTWPDGTLLQVCQGH